MLSDSNKQIRNCHEHAERCRHEAGNARTPEAKADYLNLAKNWLKLAESYEHTERVTRYLGEVEPRRS